MDAVIVAAIAIIAWVALIYDNYRFVHLWREHEDD